MWLAIEVLIFGTFVVYLLGVFPAALAAALKRHWIPFTIGYFTFGLAWFYGAVEIAKPGSWWANRFYAVGLEPETRAFDEQRKVRVRRAALVATLSIVVTGLVVARPSPFIGVDGSSLQYSVGGFLTSTDSCRKRNDDAWTCFRYDDSFSGDAAYRTSVDWSGCWDGAGVRRGPPLTDPEISGCVTLFDHLQIARVILD